MREDEVHASAVYVEVVAEVFAPHGRALAVPSWESIAPLAGPPHDVFGLCFLPEGEVYLVVLLTYSIELARVVDDIVEVSSGEFSVVVFLIVFLDIEIDGAVGDVGEAIVEDLLDELLLLDDMPCGVWLDAGWQDVEGVHSLVVAVGVVLRHLHGLELLEACLLGYLVVALVGIMFEMAYIGDVADVAHLIAEMLEVAEKDIEGDSRTGMPQMGVAIDGGAADVHAHVGRVDGLEPLFLAVERVVDKKGLLHSG